MFFRRFIGQERQTRVPAVAQPDRELLSPVHELLNVIRGALGSSFHARTPLKSPIHNDKLLASFGRKGKGRGQLDKPGGIAVTAAGDIVVADTENNRVQVFSAEGTLHHVIGQKGHEPHELNHPSDVTMVTRDGQQYILVTDSVNSCVKLFSVGGSLINIYRCEPGMMEYPCGVCVTPDGNIVVSDLIQHWVLVLSQSGSHIINFGGYGSAHHQFDHPYFVAADKNRIFVSDYGNMAIKVFTISGELLNYFSVADFRIVRDDFVELWGITRDDSGNVLVVANSSAYIVTGCGRLWDIVPPVGLDRLRAIAYSAGKLFITRHTVNKIHQILVFEYCPDNFKSLACMDLPESKFYNKRSQSCTKMKTTFDGIPMAERFANCSADQPLPVSEMSKKIPRSTEITDNTASPIPCPRGKSDSKASGKFYKLGPHSQSDVEGANVKPAAGVRGKSTRNSSDVKRATNNKAQHNTHDYDYIIGRQLPTLDYDLIERKQRMKLKAHTRISPAHIFNFQ